MFRRIALTVAALISVPALAALAPGAPAPEIKTTIAMAGKSANWSLKAALKKGPVVLYFYPAAFTPGCTLEANRFAEAIPAFRKLGATVMGMSVDTIDTLKRFSLTECRKKFPVGVASTATVKDYDVAIGGGAMSNRTSFVITPDGKIIHVYSNGDYRDHVPQTLKALQDWHASMGHMGHH
jgi:peroxiredoxin